MATKKKASKVSPKAQKPQTGQKASPSAQLKGGGKKYAGDPIAEWIAEGVREGRFTPDITERFVLGKLTYSEAQQMWLDAHR